MAIVSERAERPFRPRGSRSARAEDAYEKIRDAISGLVLQPGQSLTEASVAEWVGLGRTPVREALLRLRDEGLIESVPRKGYFVSTLSADDAQDIYEMLEGLEGMAVKLAAERADPEGLERLEKAVCQMEDALAKGDQMAWALADERVHGIILELAGNRQIQRVVESLNFRIRRLQIFTIRMGRDRTQSTHAHRAMFEAIRSGNGKLARKIRQDLWTATRKDLVGIVRNYSGSVGTL